MGATVEFENDRVRVLRIKHWRHERHAETSRSDRLVIYLNQGHVRRSEGGKSEEIERKAGEIVWRSRSQHQVENLDDTDHEVVIVELKERS
jgi:hypothetical protein